MGRQSGSRQAGRVEQLEQRLRKDTHPEGAPVGYLAGGLPEDWTGDQQAPHVKNPPFPSDEQSWLRVRFTADGGEGEVREPLTYPPGNYFFLPVLEIGHVRTITVCLELTGNSAVEATPSQFSVIPGSVLAGANPLNQWQNPGEDVDFVASFFPLGVVDLNPTTVALADPFENSPAVSREIMPSEFRTQVLTGPSVSERTLRLSLQWDVSPFERFTLAVADLREGDEVSSLQAWYTYSM